MPSPFVDVSTLRCMAPVGAEPTVGAGPPVCGEPAAGEWPPRCEAHRDVKRDDGL